jgi:hypothetical protein
MRKGSLSKWLEWRRALSSFCLFSLSFFLALSPLSMLRGTLWSLVASHRKVDILSRIEEEKGEGQNAPSPHSSLAPSTTP